MRYLAILTVLALTPASWASPNWNPADSTPEPTGRSAIGQVGRYVYVFGGGPSGNAAFAYDCSTSHWVSSTPFPLGYRANWACAAAQGKLYLLGGSDSLNPKSDVYAFLPDTGGSGAWTPLASLPRPLALLGAASLGDSLIITAGGLTYLGYATSQCFRYHIAQDRWDTLNPLPQARAAGGLAELGGKLYYLGGLDSASLSFTKTIYEYDPALNQWQSRRSLLSAIAFNHQSIAADTSQVYLVGGGAGVPFWPGSQLVQAWNPQNDSLVYQTSLPETVGVQSTCCISYHGTRFLLTTGGYQNSVFVSRTYLAQVPFGVEQGGNPVIPAPEAPLLYPVVPNPGRSPVLVRFFISRPGPVKLGVYDLQGQLIRTLASGLKPAGETSLRYDGMGQDGKPIPAGVYFLTLTTPYGTATRTFIRLR